MGMLDKDHSQTVMLSGEVVPKDDIRLEAIGDLDELSSMIGFAGSLAEDGDEVREVLREVQGHLFIIGAQISGMGAGCGHPRLSEKHYRRILELAEGYEARLPPLKRFIFPGGSRLASALHVARAMARRCERRLVALSRRHSIDPLLIAYMGGLSRLLFALARYANVREGVGEELWDAGRMEE